jgi:hypothetical protein
MCTKFLELLKHPFTMIVGMLFIMSPSLAKEMKPAVSNSLSKVGAVQAYDNVMKKYLSVPF